jgi:hypothetical protein
MWNAGEFLKALAGVTDPETKRKTIGALFIDVFEREAKKIGGAQFLVQGTLYPDVVESVSFTGGPSVTIKSHHSDGSARPCVGPRIEARRENAGMALGAPKWALERLFGLTDA